MEDTPGIEVRQDLRQSPEYGRYMEKIGWNVARLGDVQVFLRKLGPLGIAKIQRPRRPLPGKEMEEIVIKERVFMIKWEPVDGGKVLKGFKQDGWPLLGTKTLRIDLRPREEQIRAGFKKDARSILRKLEAGNWKLEKNDGEGFYEIWRKSARRKNLWIPKQKDYWALVECFGRKCFCLTAQGQAGALILTHQGTAYYYYAGATKEGNESNLPYLAAWEAMKEAKGRGCKVWDWEGIYDPRWPNRGWRGFSHFKKSFGGVEVEYPGCFSKWRWPW